MLAGCKDRSMISFHLYACFPCRMKDSLIYFLDTAGEAAEPQADMGNAPEVEHPHADHAAGVTAVPASENAPPSLGTSSQSVAPPEEGQQVASAKKDIPPPSGKTCSSQAAITPDMGSLQHGAS